MQEVGSVPARARDFARRSIAVYAAAGLAVYTLWPALGQEVAPCGGQGAITAGFLSCVVRLMESAEKEGSIGRAVLAEPLRGELGKLTAATEGYSGTATDIDKLKRWSTDLKRNPSANREAINVLDNAIASHVDEIRPAISTTRLARKAAPGTNIHPLFVRQKYEFLGSDKAKFYDGGPFEIARRTLLANTLEESSFLERQAGEPDREKLRREIKLLDEIMERYTQPEFGYLTVHRRNLLINSTLFWRATLLFVLDDKEELRKALSTLVEKNAQFDLGTTNPGHVYIYRVLDLPYEMIVQPGLDSDGAPKLEMKNQNLLKRYYNPAQLALASCAFIDTAGVKGVQDFIGAINDLALTDYFIVAASADSDTKLMKLDALIADMTKGEGLERKRKNLMASVAAEGGMFPAIMERGAERCRISKEVRDAIYSPFQFRSETKKIEEPGKKEGYALLYGGRLNAAQANAVSDFLNSEVLSSAGALELKNSLGITDPAHVARPRIDE